MFELCTLILDPSTALLCLPLPGRQPGVGTDKVTHPSCLKTGGGPFTSSEHQPPFPWPSPWGQPGLPFHDNASTSTAAELSSLVRKSSYPSSMLGESTAPRGGPFACCAEIGCYLSRMTTNFFNAHWALSLYPYTALVGVLSTPPFFNK